MLSGSERSFRGSGINHNDLRFMTVPANSLPEDRMGDAKIGANQNDDVRFFEVLVSVRGRIAAEGLFIGGNSRPPGLASVCIPLNSAHSTLWPGASVTYIVTT